MFYFAVNIEFYKPLFTTSDIMLTNTYTENFRVGNIKKLSDLTEGVTDLSCSSEMRSPCEKSNGGCIELCLPTSELDGGKEVHRVHQNRRCKCRDHYEVDPDTNKCEGY